MGWVYSAEVIVDAAPDRVWTVLTDFESYADWNAFNPGVVTSLEAGSPVALTVRMWPWMFGGVPVRQVEQVREVVPGQRLVWGAEILGGLVSAERIQTLEAVEGGTRYRTVDTIGGPLSWVVAGLFGRSLSRGFARMARDLARACERPSTAKTTDS